MFDGDAGYCDDGLGDEPEGDDFYKTCQGVHYEVKSNPGQSFDVSFQPEAFGNFWAGPSNGHSADTMVLAKVELLDIKVVLTGWTPVNTKNQIQIGQKLGMELQYPAELANASNTFTWDVPAAFNPFKDYTPSVKQTSFAPSSITAWQPALENVAQTYCRLAKAPTIAGQMTVTCTFACPSKGITATVTNEDV
jgi:hypothetical protein